MTVGATIDTSKLALTFADEFDVLRSSPDGSTGLWKTSYAWGNRTLGSNNEQQFYSDASVGADPFTVRNGVLDITAQPGANPLGLPYVSGAITTESSFSQLYGYFEIRAEMPEGQGLWPAFWLLPADRSWPPELDVIEVLGHDPGTLYFSTHSNVQATEGTTIKVVDTSDGFHTYGALWGPQKVAMFVDGVQVAEMNTPGDMHKEMYMLANLAVGGYWPGMPDATTPFPATMSIDYIRAYAYPGTAGGAVTATDPSQNIGATNVMPEVFVPVAVNAPANAAARIAGVQVRDTWPGGDFTVTVSDTAGRLGTDDVAGVLRYGQGTQTLTLIGKLAEVNAALATLTYTGNGSGEWVWVAATDPQGKTGVAHLTAAPDVANTPGPVAPPPAPPAAGANTAPVVDAPATLSLGAGGTMAIAGVQVDDSDPSGLFTAMVSGGSGAFRTEGDTDARITGQGTASLSLSGTAAAINAELATLTLEAGDAPGTEWIWISANDGQQAQGVASMMLTVTAPRGLAGQIVNGGAAADTLRGGAGDDLLRGRDGNDLMIGRTGADSFDGGAGNDIISIDSERDVVVDGGAGTDIAAIAKVDGLALQVGGWTGVERVYGARGADAIDARGATADLHLAGGAGDDTLAGGAGRDLLVGGDGDDLLRGREGIDRLFGGGGDDTLAGGAGFDVLQGGEGADLFRLGTSALGGTGGPVDRILDFASGEGDRIDLVFIDADRRAEGDQAFAFIGGAAFTGAGQLRSQVVGANTYVYGNTDGNLATAEFVLRLDGALSLSAAAFVV